MNLPNFFTFQYQGFGLGDAAEESMNVGMYVRTICLFTFCYYLITTSNTVAAAVQVLQQVLGYVQVQVQIESALLADAGELRRDVGRRGAQAAGPDAVQQQVAAGSSRGH